VAHKDRLTPNDQHIYMRSTDLPFYERDLPILMPEVQCPHRTSLNQLPLPLQNKGSITRSLSFDSSFRIHVPYVSQAALFEFPDDQQWITCRFGVQGEATFTT
jgi:hypothetical protein